MSTQKIICPLHSGYCNGSEINLSPAAGERHKDFREILNEVVKIVSQVKGRVLTFLPSFPQLCEQK